MAKAKTIRVGSEVYIEKSVVVGLLHRIQASATNALQSLEVIVNEKKPDANEPGTVPQDQKTS